MKKNMDTSISYEGSIGLVSNKSLARPPRAGVCPRTHSYSQELWYRTEQNQSTAPNFDANLSHVLASMEVAALAAMKLRLPAKRIQKVMTAEG